MPALLAAEMVGQREDSLLNSSANTHEEPRAPSLKGEQHFLEVSSGKRTYRYDQGAMAAQTC